MRPLFFALIICLSSPIWAQDLDSKEYLLGKFNPAEHENFRKIEAVYCSKPGMYLHEDTYAAFKRMYYAAEKCGVKLTIISATRSFAYQRGIWQRKWRSERFSAFQGEGRAREIMKYSAMPGASRHHWGTDIDINDLNNDYFSSGKGKEEYEWLISHAADYGFYQTYTSKDNGRTGYEEEKWHWTYLPISEQLLKSYNDSISYADIKGFSGSEYAQPLQIIRDFVNGIELEK